MKFFKYMVFGVLSMTALVACAETTTDDSDVSTSEPAAAEVDEQEGEASDSADTTAIAASETAETEETEESETESAADGTFEAFWPEFQAAVAAGDAEKVADLSVTPLPNGDAGEEWTREEFIASYDTLLGDEVAKAAIAMAPADGVEQLDDMPEQYSVRYNTPVGESVRQVVVKEGELSRTFVFGNSEGDFELRSLILLQGAK